MRVSTKSTLIACTLALATAGGSLAFGHGAGGGGCGHGGFLGGRRILRALDLSAEQQSQVRDIVTAHRPTLTQLRANETAARQAIMDKLLGTGGVTAQDLDPLVQQAVQARSALMHERLATALAVRNVLTSAQIQKAATIRSSMKQLHAQMRQLLGNEGTD